MLQRWIGSTEIRSKTRINFNTMEPCIQAAGLSLLSVQQIRGECQTNMGKSLSKLRSSNADLNWSAESSATLFCNSTAQLTSIFLAEGSLGVRVKANLD